MDPAWKERLDESANRWQVGAGIDRVQPRNPMVWGDARPMPIGSQVQLVALHFDRPTTVALDWQPPTLQPGAGLGTPRFGFIVRVGFGRAAREEQYDDLPRLVTGQTISVVAVRIDALVAFVAPVLAVWATPCETPRPSLTVIRTLSVAGLAAFAALAESAIDLSAIPPDATHMGLLVDYNAANLLPDIGIRQTVSGVVMRQYITSQQGGCGPPVPILRQATSMAVFTGPALNAGGINPTVTFLR